MHQTLERKLALNNGGRVGFLDEIHVAVRLGAENARTGKIALTRKDQIAAHRLDLDAIRDAVQVADNLLDIGRGKIDDRRVLDGRHLHFLSVGLNESQLLAVALLDVPIVVLQAQVGHNAVMIVVFINVHAQRVVIGHGRNHFEEMECIGTDDNLFWDTRVHFKLVGVQQDVDQDRVRLVKVDDFQTRAGVGDGGIRENVFDGRDHVTNWLDLYGFDGKYIVGFVHSCSVLYILE